MSVFSFDPGTQGACAFVSPDVVAASKLHYRPSGKRNGGRELEVNSLIDTIRLSAPDLIVIERQWSRPGNAARSGTSMMLNYGKLLAAIDAARINCELLAITPQTWQRLLFPGAKDTKAASIAFATSALPDQSLIPPRGRVPSDGIADALCIAWCGLYHADSLRGAQSTQRTMIDVTQKLTPAFVWEPRERTRERK